MIFDIQKYSIHDGPGIRTTVFFKGCPLNCWWCHNPEGQSLRPEVVHWRERCIGCGTCRKSCPNEAIRADGIGIWADEKRCRRCGTCAENCAAGALEMTGKRMTVAEVMGEIEKDLVFYDQSGGGVTFSGGEPLTQFKFLYELISQCKKKGIHTAVDTSGYAPWDVVEKIAASADLLLYDLKLINSKKHEKYTGVSNTVILENLRRLAAVRKNIYIRIPVIPNVNDGENLVETAKLLSSLKLTKVFLLPYHKTALDKYTRLKKVYRLADLEPPLRDEMKSLARIFEDYNLNVKLGG